MVFQQAAVESVNTEVPEETLYDMYSFLQDFNYVQTVYQHRNGNSVQLYAEKMDPSKKVIVKKESIKRQENKISELRVLEQVSNHPNIPSLEGVIIDEKNDTLFPIIEYVPSKSLDQIIRAVPEIVTPVHERINLAVRVTLEIGDALSYLHSKGLVHRDVKTSNILRRDDSSCYLIDFNISEVIGTLEKEWINGTVYFYAPERLLGAYHSHPAQDYYSLGCVLYTALKLSRPHEDLAKSPHEFFSTLANGILPTYLGKDTSIPKSLVRIVKKLMNISPSKRHVSMDVLHNEILQFAFNYYSKTPSHNTEEVLQTLKICATKYSQFITDIPATLTLGDLKKTTRSFEHMIKKMLTEAKTVNAYQDVFTLLSLAQETPVTRPYLEHLSKELQSFSTPKTSFLQEKLKNILAAQKQFSDVSQNPYTQIDTSLQTLYKKQKSLERSLHILRTDTKRYSSLYYHATGKPLEKISFHYCELTHKLDSVKNAIQQCHAKKGIDYWYWKASSCVKPALEKAYSSLINHPSPKKKHVPNLQYKSS